MRLIALWLVVVLGVLGCGRSDPLPTFAVTFTTESDPGEVLSGVEVFAGGRSIGTSGSEGIVQTVVRGPDGSRMPITYTCPEGYVTPEAPVTLLLQSFQGMDPENDVGLTTRLVCPRAKRRVVILVRTNDKADLPVVVNGREVGRTGTRGVAHVAVEDPPGTAYRVRLDTSGQPGLRPQNPIRSFSLGDTDEVFVFDQEFEGNPPPEPARARPRRQHRRRAPRTGSSPVPFLVDI